MSKISSDILAILQEIGRAGDRASQSVYVVGGFVRDLLLGRDNLDLDIVVEGDAIRLGRHLADVWGGTFQAHPSFGTGTLTRPDGFKIDFVTARCETYERPGALPLVRSGTIIDDLRRRDFSVNALAIQLNADAFGNLVDCADGWRDLRAGRIRALHDRSFLDDPTRIFRAIRYEGRYGFRLTEADERLIREAIRHGAVECISGERIRNEFERILAEEAAPRIIQRMRELNLFHAIHPDWNVPLDFDALWDAAHCAMGWAGKHLPNEPVDTELIRWMTLLGVGTPTYAIEVVTDRLALPHHLRKLFRIGVEYQAELEASLLPEVLRTTFANHGISLSQAVSIQAERNRWFIADKGNNQTFVIRNEKGARNVYQIQTKLVAVRRLHETLEALSPRSKPSEIYRLLNPFPLETLVFALMHPNQPERRAEQIRDYLTNLRGVQPLMNGDDLIRLGLKPSRAFTEVLSKTFAAQLDGEILTKQDAYQFLGYE